MNTIRVAIDPTKTYEQPLNSSPANGILPLAYSSTSPLDLDCASIYLKLRRSAPVVNKIFNILFQGSITRRTACHIRTCAPFQKINNFTHVTVLPNAFSFLSVVWFLLCPL